MDDAFLRRLRKGDEAAWTELRERCGPGMLRAVAAMTRTGGGPDMDPEDVVAAAWMKAWRGIKTVKQPQYIKTWLISVARHEALTTLRARRRERAKRVDWDIARAITLEVAYSDPLVRRDVFRALGTMRPSYSLPLALHYIEGWTIVEIGEKLGVSPGTVKTRMHRGRDMLRDALGSEPEQDA